MTKQLMIIGFLAVLLSLLMPLTAAVPLRRQATDADYNPESAALARNGDLPADTDNKYGMAKNISTYPDTVQQALLSTTGVRIASAEEVATQKFYTTLSANSYCRTVIPGSQWDCPNCAETSNLVIVKTFTTLVSDTNAMVVRDDDKKYIYIVFRGSNSIRNFIADFVFEKIDYPPVKGTKVHKGFYNSYMEVQKDLMATFMDQFNDHSNYKVAVTGHSLGGAQALLCALDLYQRDQRFNADVLSLYTQGQPRVGDDAFADYVVGTKFNYDRAVHERDIVPHLPPAAFGFLHAGEEYWITNDDKQVDVCPNGIETDNCSDSIVPWTSALDHLT
ncbi:lipase [Syncephalastrum racemosum]|uniref:Lipase n=1 Tax=Syncephalastrum racemosum TaxID=13706 RepID=A0A1X2HJZ2_SYNRA|nr:lipase [Syncephalastrum racemosum]